MSVENAPNPPERDQTPPTPVEDTGIPNTPPSPEPAPEPPEPAPARDPDEPFVPARARARREILDRFREQRQPARDFDGDLTRPSNLYGDHVPQARAPEEGDEPEPVPAEPGPTPPPRQPGVAEQPPSHPQGQQHELVVRGRTMRLTREQVIEQSMLSTDEAKAAPWHVVEALARKNIAAQSYLDEGKERLRDIAIREGQPQPAGPRAPAEPDRQRSPAHTEPTAPTPDRVKLLENLVLGSPEEQAEALATLESQIEERIKGKVLPESANMARAELLGRAVADDSEQAIAAVVSEHPEFAQRTPAAATFGMHITEMGKLVMVEALRGLPESEQLRLAQMGFHEGAINQITDPQRVGALYRDMVQKGWKLPRPSAVINAAKNVTLQQLGRAPGQATPQAKPGAVTVNVDRTERKAGLPQQPTRASAPPQARTQGPSSNVIDPAEHRQQSARRLIERRQAKRGPVPARG